jgi:L-alanine-DL-glutamate epimerase-like enolase superfamily enzyme
MRISALDPIPLAGRGRQGAYGAPYGLVVRVTTDTGIIGYGETDSMPSVVKAVIEAPFVHEMMSGLKWVLLDRDPLDVEARWADMTTATLNYSRDGATLEAMAAIDLALWDIRGKALGAPVYELLGGARRKTLRCYATHPLGRNLEETSRFASILRDQGFSAVKFGWRPLGQDPVQDEAIVRCLRRAIGQDLDLLIDAGLAWDVDTALERIRQFEPYRLFWLEEPISAYDFEGYKKLTAESGTPIAAGELASSSIELSRLVEQQCVHVLQVDVSRVGLTQAMKIAEFAAARGIPSVNHSYTYGISLAASLHFAAAIERTSLFEYQATPNEIRDVLTPDMPKPTDGTLALPEGAGLGIEVDEDALCRFAVVS